MATLLLTLVLFIISCGENKLAEEQKFSDRFYEAPEHHIKDSANIPKQDSSVLSTGWYYVLDTPNEYKRLLDKSDEAYYLNPTPITTAKNIRSFEIYESSHNGKKYYGLAMRLDGDGTKSWSYATGRAEVMRLRLAFVLDNKLLQVAKVNSQITSGMTALNRSEYSLKELQNFKTMIKRKK